MRTWDHLSSEEAASADMDAPDELPSASPAPWRHRQPVLAALLVANVPLFAQLLEGENTLLSLVALGALNGALGWAREIVTPIRDPKLEQGVPLRVP